MYSGDVDRYYDLRMIRDNTVAVVGAGVIGAAVAYALAREGRAVLLIDRAEPGIAERVSETPGTSRRNW